MDKKNQVKLLAKQINELDIMSEELEKSRSKLYGQSIVLNNKIVEEEKNKILNWLSGKKFVFKMKSQYNGIIFVLESDIPDELFSDPCARIGLNHFINLDERIFFNMNKKSEKFEIRFPSVESLYKFMEKFNIGITNIYCDDFLNKIFQCANICLEKK